MTHDIEKIMDSTNLFVENEIIDEDRIQLVSRPPYFNQYHFCIGFTPEIQFWYQFDDIKLELIKLIGDLGHLVCNKGTLSYVVYANDPTLLRILFAKSDTFIFGYISIIHSDYWDLKLPAPRIKRKTKFYRTFNYRVRFDARYNKNDLDINKELERLTGDWVWSYGHDNLLYVKKLGDVTILKIMMPDKIVDIEDRSLNPD